MSVDVKIECGAAVDDMWLALKCCVPTLPSWECATEEQRSTARKFYASGNSNLNELARLVAQ